MKSKILFIYAGIFFILYDAGITEAKIKPPIFTIGKIEAKISGIVITPISAAIVIKLISDNYLLPFRINTFRLKIDFESQSILGIEEECLVEINVAKEISPGKWEPIVTESQRLICPPEKLRVRKEIITPKIVQHEDEIRYRITVSSFLCGAQDEKETVIIVKQIKKESHIYTIIPYLPLTLLHDPSGDTSYTFITPEDTITHILGVDLGTVCSLANQEQVVFFSSDNSKLTIKPYTKDFIKITYTPAKELTSMKVSDNPDVIGHGYGDVYLIAKNIPVKISYLRDLKEGLKIFFQLVPSKEEGFDIIELPAACLREPDKDHPIFGTWREFGIDEEFRNELIRLNIGWDNNITSSEKGYVMEIGKEVLNKKKIERRYKQQSLVPMEFKVRAYINTQFAKEVQIPNEDGITNIKFILNPKGSPHFDRVTYSFAILDDNDCPDDSFIYHVYFDKLFNTPLFITDIDNSVSSEPFEYWTFYPFGNLIIDITIPTSDGQEIKLPNEAIKGCIFQLDDIILTPKSSPPGRYKISKLKVKSYNFLVSVPGFIKDVRGVKIEPNGTTFINVELIPENLLLYGRVKDISTDIGIENAIIQVRENDKLMGIATTDSLGNYMIIGLPVEATYAITTIATGYETKITNITPIGDRIINREIYLIKK